MFVYHLTWQRVFAFISGKKIVLFKCHTLLGHNLFLSFFQLGVRVNNAKTCHVSSHQENQINGSASKQSFLKTQTMQLKLIFKVLPWGKPGNNWNLRYIKSPLSKENCLHFSQILVTAQAAQNTKFRLPDISCCILIL